MLVMRGYTPKGAVELVLHEIMRENGHDAKAMQKARDDAQVFLERVAKGLI